MWNFQGNYQRNENQLKGICWKRQQETLRTKRRRGGLALEVGHRDCFVTHQFREFREKREKTVTSVLTCFYYHE